MKKIQIMKPVDQFIFKGINKLTQTPEYQKIIDFYSSLDEEVQSFFKLVLIAFSVTLPLFLVFLFYLLNSSASSSLTAYQNIIKSASKILSQTSSVQSQSRKYFGTSPLSTRTSFENELKNTLSLTGIDTSKISTANYDSLETDGVNEVSAELKFKDLSSANFFGLLNSMTSKNKIKFEEISIKKNKQTNLLEGTAKVLYFSKVSLENNL